MEWPTVSAQASYRITITRERPTFLCSRNPHTLIREGLEEVQVTRVSLHSPSSAGEQGAVQCAKDHLERFRAQTAEYFGMPDHKVICLYEIDSVGTYDWEMGYRASMAELESGDVLLEEGSSPRTVVVMCCGTVRIEGPDFHPARKK